MTKMMKLTEEQVRVAKDKQFNRLCEVSQSTINTMTDRLVFDRIQEIRDRKNIVDYVNVFPFTIEGVDEKTERVLNDYIKLVYKYCEQYNIKLKNNISKDNLFSDKFNWVNKMHSQVNLFPPMLAKACKDMLSNKPTILTEELSCHLESKIVGYFRESNLFEDFLLCSSYKAWSSCAAFGRNGQGRNSPFIYSQSKNDSIVFLFETQEDAINGDNAIARMIVSTFNDQIITHRLYGNGNYSETEVKSSYLSAAAQELNLVGEIDTTTLIRARCKGIKHAYPDISVSACFGTIISNEENKEEIIKKNLDTMQNEYSKTQVDMIHD